MGSSFIDALKYALTNDRDNFDFILIYKDSSANVYVVDTYEDKAKYDFDLTKVASDPSEVIYYNPALDHKIYPIKHDENNWVDISTDWLIYQDYQDFKSTIPELSQIEIHRARDIERQLNLFNDSQFSALINEKIRIPEFVSIDSSSSDFPHKIKDSNSAVRNVPYALRPYYDLLFEKVVPIVNKYASDEERFNNQRKISRSFNPHTRKKCYATFLNHLLINMFYHFEKTNHFLDKGKVSIDKSDLDKLQFEDAVIKFIENIDIIDDTKVIIDFIKYTRELIFKAKVEFHDFGNISWTASKNDLKNFLELKYSYLNQLSRFTSYRGEARSFISYGWEALSTGEKAMFNLYSRFYYAKQLIIKKVKSEDQAPKFIYILIDEAELGFHLQWQKEYIYDLIEYLPKTLVMDLKNSTIEPKVQIIFTTHSTMSLSDIPNSHINYLINQRDSPLVLLGDEKPRKSFGANVHSLMSDSFFLRDGLVGKLAISKINSVIKTLNKDPKKLNQEMIDKAESIINIVDEPVLRKKLESMLAELTEPKQKKIARLERIKKDVENRINALKRDD